MPTIKNNSNSALAINYVGGHSSRADFYPGINLNVPQCEWDAMRKHPSVIAYLEAGILDSLTREPGSKGELSGFAVTDDKKTDEPLPITEIKLSGKSEEAKTTTRKTRVKKIEE